MLQGCILYAYTRVLLYRYVVWFESQIMIILSFNRRRYPKRMMYIALGEGIFKYRIQRDLCDRKTIFEYPLSEGYIHHPFGIPTPIK
jgi:hypothetical protein